jgi:hypothetical protein
MCRRIWFNRDTPPGHGAPYRDGSARRGRIAASNAFWIKTKEDRPVIFMTVVNGGDARLTRRLGPGTPVDSAMTESFA